jgi:hypothetical protein
LRKSFSWHPHLATEENALALSAYAMSRARVELLSVAIEAAVAQAGAVKLGARIIEAVTAASREEAQQRASLGLDPRSLAELRQLKAQTAVTMSVLVREARRHRGPAADVDGSRAG